MDLLIALSQGLGLAVAAGFVGAPPVAIGATAASADLADSSASVADESWLLIVAWARPPSSWSPTRSGPARRRASGWLARRRRWAGVRPGRLGRAAVGEHRAGRADRSGGAPSPCGMSGPARVKPAATCGAPPDRGRVRLRRAVVALIRSSAT
jgi:hypothetical protein